MAGSPKNRAREGFIPCDRLGAVIPRQKHHPPAFDFDTEHSIRAVDLEIQIPNACPASGTCRNRYGPPSYPGNRLNWAIRHNRRTVCLPDRPGIVIARLSKGNPLDLWVVLIQNG